MRIQKKLLKELTYFGIVGGLTFLTDLIVTTALYNLLHFPAFLASGIGFSSGFFFNFPLNRKKVFRHSQDDRYPFRLQIIFYASLSVFNLFATSLITDLLVTTGHLRIAYAKIAVTVLIAVWNFLIFKLFIFSKRKNTHTTGLDERVLNDII